MIEDGQPINAPSAGAETAPMSPMPALPALEVAPPALAQRWSSAVSRDWRIVIALTVLGLLIRLVYGMWLHPIGQNLYSDMQGHYSNALTFADPHHVANKWDIVKPRAMGMVGSFILRHFGTKASGLQIWGLLQILLSSACIPLGFIGVRRCFGRKAALLAAAFLAVDYLAISFSGFLMVETYLAFFLTLALALLDPERPLLSLLAGVALGLGAWFKPQGALLLPFWALTMWIFGAPKLAAGTGWLRRVLATALGPTRRRLSAIALGVGVLTIIVPESIAISRLNHKLTLVSAYGGQNFYIGHCHVKLMNMDGGSLGWFSAGVPKVYQRNEPWPDVTFHASVFDNDVYMREGMKCFTQSFGFAVTWILWQLVDTFAGPPWSTIDTWPVPGGPLSGNRLFQLIIAYIYAPLAFWALWRGRRTLGAWIGFGGPMAALWTLAVMFSGDPRYRTPFDIFIVAGGSAGLLMLADKLRGFLPRIHVEILPRRSVDTPSSER
jgi:hypothetical protein